jgi:3-phosphoshikimate 1-carboxyvinyltransferase
VTLPAELVFGGVRPLRGRLRVPGDKSISHRALIFAALADGRSTITNLATGEDVQSTRGALAQCGVTLTDADGGVVVASGGIDDWREPDDVLDCGNSGTTMRVLLGALASRPFMSVLTGDASLRSRPMARVIEPLHAMGASIHGRDNGNRAPLVVEGRVLHGMRHKLHVASAQVKSALVLAGLSAEGMTEVVSPAVSRDHTERMLEALGAPVTFEGVTVHVKRGAPAPFDLDVPGDPSSAAFFVVAAAITPGSDITLEHVSCNPTRLGFVDVLQRMGADIEVRVTGEQCGEPAGELRVRASALQATTIEGDEIPNVQDEIPALAVAAAFADGVTDIRDAEELAVKESNRIATVRQELAQLGIGVEARDDGLSIRGGRPRAQDVKFDSHGDHRIAMAAAVAANALDGEATVRGWPAVASSYPEFAVDLERLTR